MCERERGGSTTTPFTRRDARLTLFFFSSSLGQVRFYETAAAFGAFRRNRYGAESDIETEVESGSDLESPSEDGDEE